VAEVGRFWIEVMCGEHLGSQVNNAVQLFNYPTKIG
jgi:hypothetical protein